MPKKEQNCQIIILCDPDKTHEVKGYFRKNKSFGLFKDVVMVETIGMVPAVDLDGKIIMCKTSEIGLSSSGSATFLQKISENP